MTTASSSRKPRYMLIGCLVCVMLPALWFVVTMLRVPLDSVPSYVTIVARDSRGLPDASVPVRVTVNGRSQGGADGDSFLLLWIQPGRNTIRCTAPGYQTCTEIIDVDPMKDSEYYAYCELLRSP